MSKPATGQAYYKALQTRYDDFIALHVNATEGTPHDFDYLRSPLTTLDLGLLTCTGGVHMVGQTFPWHRYALWTYETALRDECGYSGAQPYVS